MRFGELDEATERNIIKLLQTFHKHPAIFLSEADVQSYLYSLLINDACFINNCPVVKMNTPKGKSKTSLVHVELQID